MIAPKKYCLEVLIKQTFIDDVINSPKILCFVTFFQKYQHAYNYIVTGLQQLGIPISLLGCLILHVWLNQPYPTLLS